MSRRNSFRSCLLPFFIFRLAGSFCTFFVKRLLTTPCDYSKDSADRYADNSGPMIREWIHPYVSAGYDQNGETNCNILSHVRFFIHNSKLHRPTPFVEWVAL
jgi:hypothetical protein